MTLMKREASIWPNATEKFRNSNKFKNEVSLTNLSILTLEDITYSVNFLSTHSKGAVIYQMELARKSDLVANAHYP